MAEWRGAVRVSQVRRARDRCVSRRVGHVAVRAGPAARRRRILRRQGPRRARARRALARSVCWHADIRRRRRRRLALPPVRLLPRRPYIGRRRRWRATRRPPGGDGPSLLPHTVAEQRGAPRSHPGPRARRPRRISRRHLGVISARRCGCAGSGCASRCARSGWCPRRSRSSSRRNAPRWRRDGAEMAPRWRGDGAEMARRWRRDGAETAPRRLIATVARAVRAG